MKRTSFNRYCSLIDYRADKPKPKDEEWFIFRCCFNPTNQSAVMDQKAGMPIPIRFNAIKHHRNYLMDFLRKAPSKSVIERLDPLCNNYIDIYTGELSPHEIALAVIKKLKADNIYELHAFNEWIRSKKGYRQIKLHDKSEWVIRQSHESKQYIHIHPARTGPLVISFKGSTLKTAYILKLNSVETGNLPSLQEVNEMRKQIGLSPVKKLKQGKGILKCYEYFFR